MTCCAAATKSCNEASGTQITCYFSIYVEVTRRSEKAVNIEFYLVVTGNIILTRVVLFLLLEVAISFRRKVSLCTVIPVNKTYITKDISL